MRKWNIGVLMLLLTSIELAVAQTAHEQTLDLMKLMTPTQFRDCGLQKLSDQELGNLNKWVTHAVLEVAQTSRVQESASRAVNDSFESLEGAIIMAKDGQFLGKITTNEFDPNSLLNEFGKYGSEFSATSIFNSFSHYGSEFSNLSPYNEFTSTPPSIFKGNKFIAYLTVNKTLQPRVDAKALIGWLKSQQ
jgi:hypothetical protein